MKARGRIKPYRGPVGGWGSLRGLSRVIWTQRDAFRVLPLLAKQNKPDGFMCVSCSWAKPGEPRPLEFCENGAKATAWEVTPKRAAADFFESHPVALLRGLSDYDLENQGRLVEPLRYDPGRDRYVPVAWEEAFRHIGEELRALNPASVVFYASGRASLEASYMYQLLARMYGTNSLPDSSNMCHESTSVGLPQSIGVPVGTVLLEDFEKTDCIFFFGHNTGYNSPRMLHPLEEAAKRGVPIVTFNPLRERGLERFTNPQNVLAMALHKSTRISSQYYQLKTGGDTAAILGICKAVIAADDEARAAGAPRILDVAFIEEHTHGFDAFAQKARATPWAEIEAAAGLARGDMERAAGTYMAAKAVIVNYGMGVTQHRYGVETVRMVVNLLLLRGNIGRPGAGVSPVRGHSNVQGQRTVGMTEKPELAPLDKLKELYGFEPPREKGLATVEACEGVISGEVKAFIGLGGNFLRAVPERGLMEPAWRRLRLSVQVATKLNRTHLFPGEVTYLLPCLGRTEIDNQATGPQAVSMEDSTTCIHGSLGMAAPADPRLLSEPRIVAELAKATLPPGGKVDWDAWAGDYSKVRDAIEATYPEMFRDFNRRLFQPGGFPRPLPARERKWKTDTGKANFVLPKSLSSRIAEGDGIFQLMTLRSNGQFNTTVYNYDDRMRGIHGRRDVLFMNPADIARLGLHDGDYARMTTVAGDGVERDMSGFRVTAYGIPEGCVGAYYPECNALIPLWHHAEASKVPAAKSVPVRIARHAVAGDGAA